MLDSHPSPSQLGPGGRSDDMSSRALRLWITVALVALNVILVTVYGLWSVVGDWAADRSELHGFDPSMLLPNDAALWLAMNACVVVLIALDIMWVALALRLRRRRGSAG